MLFIFLSRIFRNEIYYYGVSTNPQGKKYEALEMYGKDLTAMARARRDDKIRRCIQILSRRTKNNPGEPGIGKTAISEGLAQRIMQGGVPQALMNQYETSEC
ncbi:Chaperone protein ClpB3, chloroplastic [Salvia divinorum]|uniref:Chaperone protein ClpB3, chloroplastic n=1 Tax=Salvia divinorum TaxID=28513 RepID=A0ABD1I4A8_SALDI